MGKEIGSTVLLDILDKFYILQFKLEEFGLELIRDPEFADNATELNVEQQLAGERSDGTTIEPPYRAFTIRKKIEKGQPIDRVTLEDEGDYHNSLRIRAYENKFEIFATDWKSDQLNDKYNSGGSQILGLQDKSIDELRSFMLPDFISFVRFYFNIQ